MGPDISRAPQSLSLISKILSELCLVSQDHIRIKFGLLFHHKLLHFTLLVKIDSNNLCEFNSVDRILHILCKNCGDNTKNSTSLRLKCVNSNNTILIDKKKK